MKSDSLSINWTASSKKTKQKGAATTEVIIAMFAFIPLFFAINVIGKQSDLKASAVSTARYHAWERTVWSDSASPWTDSKSGANHEKSDADISLEASHRLLQHRQGVLLPVGVINSNTPTNDPLWTDIRGDAMLSESDQHLRSRSNQVTERSASGYQGLYTQITNRVGSLSRGNFIETSAEVPFKIRIPGGIKGDCNGQPDCNENAGEFALNYKVKAGILSDSWTPGDESGYGGIVEGIRKNTIMYGADMSERADCMANQPIGFVLSFLRGIDCDEYSQFSSTDLPASGLEPYSGP